MSIFYLNLKLMKHAATPFRLGLLLFISLAFSSNLFAQTITGVVLDAKKNPLIAADVLVKGEKNGATTDEDGRFTIEVASLPVTLEIFYQGHCGLALTFNSYRQRLQTSQQ